VGYLSPQQRQAVLIWLQTQAYWNLEELQAHIEAAYEIVFDSKQSYYSLFKEAGISWKKTQKCNPKTEPEMVQKKEEITKWLNMHRREIESGECELKVCTQ
jgi:putative transposase